MTHSRNSSFRNAIKVVLVGLALFAGMGLAPAAATAGTDVQSAAVVQVAKAPSVVQAVAPATANSTAAVWCSWSWNAYRVDYNCDVYSGYMRVWAYCNGWGYVYTPWVGVGSWHLWVDCGSYTLGSFGRQYA